MPSRRLGHGVAARRSHRVGIPRPGAQRASGPCRGGHVHEAQQSFNFSAQRGQLLLDASNGVGPERNMPRPRPQVAGGSSVESGYARMSHVVRGSDFSRPGQNSSHLRRRRYRGHTADRGVAARRDDPMAGDRGPTRAARTPWPALTRWNPALTGGTTSPLLSAMIVSSGGSTACSRSSAAPSRSRRKSSPVASVCSLTRTSTKPVLPVSDTMLGEKLELALLRKSMSGSAGPCSLELLSWGYRAVKAGSTGIEVGGRQNAE